MVHPPWLRGLMLQYRENQKKDKLFSKPIPWTWKADAFCSPCSKFAPSRQGFSLLSTTYSRSSMLWVLLLEGLEFLSRSWVQLVGRGREEGFRRNSNWFSLLKKSVQGLLFINMAQKQNHSNKPYKNKVWDIIKYPNLYMKTSWYMGDLMIYY